MHTSSEGLPPKCHNRSQGCRHCYSDCLGRLHGYEQDCMQDARFHDMPNHFRLSITRGGFGVTAEETRDSAACYTVVSHSFRFTAIVCQQADAHFSTLCDTHKSDTIRSSPFFKDYCKDHNFILGRSAFCAEAPDATSPSVSFMEIHPRLPTSRLQEKGHPADPQRPHGGLNTKPSLHNPHLQEAHHHQTNF